MAVDTDPNTGDGQLPGEAQTMLPRELGLTQAQPLRTMMLGLLARGPAVLDAGEVERMSTPCAQVLLATGRAAMSGGVSFKIRNASAVFQAAVAELGLQPEFSNWIE